MTVTASGSVVNVPSGVTSQRSDYKDASLGLITSGRIITIYEIGEIKFRGDQIYVLHRIIFRKEFPTLLKIFKS